jgi:hypothetical protein
MTRRTVVAMLWFVAFALAGEIVWSIGVTPRPLGLVAAAAVAAFVWLDPIRQLHPRARPSVGITPRTVEAGLRPR